VIQSGLERLMAGRTSLIVAHRLSTIKNADRILVLHQGRLVEMGNHEALLARNGLYARLYRLQYLDGPPRGSDLSLLDTEDGMRSPGA
jgi:ABC-type multidrug transport system fused ATPase/permease subunit